MASNRKFAKQSSAGELRKVITRQKQAGRNKVARSTHKVYKSKGGKTPFNKF